MPDEQNYRSHLLSIEDAMRYVSGGERNILQYAWELYCYTLTELENQKYLAEKEKGDLNMSTVLMMYI